VHQQLAQRMHDCTTVPAPFSPIFKKIQQNFAHIFDHNSGTPRPIELKFLQIMQIFVLFRLV